MNLKLSFKAPTYAQQKDGVITFVTLQFVSQAAHVGWGFIFVVVPYLLTGSMKVFWWSVGIVAVAAAIKEWWDVHGLEDPATSGGVQGSLQDFAFWCVGDGLAVGTVLLSVLLRGKL
jgi:hypothetical protein